MLFSQITVSHFVSNIFCFIMKNSTPPCTPSPVNPSVSTDASSMSESVRTVNDSTFYNWSCVYNGQFTIKILKSCFSCGKAVLHKMADVGPCRKW